MPVVQIFLFPANTDLKILISSYDDPGVQTGLFKGEGGPHCVKQRVIICFRHLNNTVCSNKAHKGGGGVTGTSPATPLRSDT